MSVIIAVQRSEIQQFGANAAIVLQQIRHWLDHERGDWFTQTSEELSRLCGLSADQVRRAVRRLLEAEVLEKTKLRAKQGDQTCSYRPIEPLDSAPGDSANSGPGNSANSRDGDSANSSSSSDIESNTSPTPPEEGDSSGAAQAKLFEAGRKGGGATLNSELKHRTHRRSSAGAAGPEFELFWKSYPNDGVKGNKQAAARRFSKLREEGQTPGDIRAHLDHYVAARQLYAGLLDGELPTMMRTSSFLNGKYEMFEGPWTEEHVRSYWRPPGGREWGQPKRKSVQEILAEAREEVEAIAAVHLGEDPR